MMGSATQEEILDLRAFYGLFWRSAKIEFQTKHLVAPAKSLKNEFNQAGAYLIHRKRITLLRTTLHERFHLHEGSQK
jgi:hypothetical protein